MKTFTLLTTLCLISFVTTNIQSQGELSILMGMHPVSRIYQASTGTHTAIQYNMVTNNNMSYGVIAQYSRFNQRLANTATPHIASFNGFASYPIFETSIIKPYLKMEIGAAYASTNPSLESRTSTNDAQAANFISAQIVPAIGSQIMVSRSIALQVEYKKTIHYANALVANGDYNYGSIDLGFTYKFSATRSNKHSYVRSLPRCSYKKGGTSRCFSFR